MVIELHVTVEKPPSLQDYLRNLVGVPKGLLHELRMSKEVKVNHEEPVWTHSLRKGDIISLPLFQEEVSPTPTNIDLSILYEDEHLLILNKDAGIDTHPASENDYHSLTNGVAYYFIQQSIHSKVRHIHRLDKETSGAILFAKHALSGAILDRELEARKIKRTYLALVEGLVETSQGTINKPIGKDRHHASRRRISPNGQIAITHFKVVKKFPKEKLTLVELNLDTGRTHQIRVHMSSLGHPLFGDTLYGAKSKHTRHSLHAWKLEVPQPFKQEGIFVTAPIPLNFGPPLLSLNIEKL
ncbi:RluA family pseudouridine synthase [Sutcliffiella halmapala]|uniref:RluA family pseudouridine synthase n=1 Tax=Sutcliffiella halmapala TaxID=79882 RepID=UPI00099597CF|nr:RluA family pseudouridine synthase [Sutcliffiella halmapala]